MTHAPASTRAAGAAMLVALLAAACDGPAAPPAQRPAASEITWRAIGSWSGGPDQLTESFEVSTAAMRLRWQTTRETAPGAGHLTVTLHSAASGRPLQTIVDARGVGSATVEVADEPRWAYFVIEAADVEWQATLEQGFAGNRR
ncbi:MAG: hypothetical protein R2708_28615 [Vicinamibacterales bacterium]